MIDKVTSKIKRYPFQTGIITGVIACLLIVGFFSLFQDHGRTLSGNSEIIQQDYLRMTIDEYSRDRDSQLAEWRYKHLGNQADKTLELMRADESVTPQNLVNFAEAIGKKDKIGSINTAENGQAPEGTPANPKKGLSGFGKVLLVLVGLVIIAAGGLYAASLVKTKKKQKRRTENNQRIEEDALNMITQEKARAVDGNTSDTLFDLDSLFPQNDSDKSKQAGSPDVETEKNDDAVEQPSVEKDDLNVTDEEAEKTQDTGENETLGADDTTEAEVPEENSEPETEPEQSTDDEIINKEAKTDAAQSKESVEPENEAIEPEPENTDEEPSKKEDHYFELEYETETNSASPDNKEDAEPIRDSNDVNDKTEENHEEVQEVIPEAQKNEPDNPEKSEDELSAENDAEKPLVEVDHENESENEDELLKMIRAGQTEPEKENVVDEGKPETDEAGNENSDAAYERKDIGPDEPSAADEPASPEEETGPDDSQDDVLIHYQSQYRIGNDMYDEVFSIDQGDVFRGECGIGIGETLNNTEPKAVTAFEVWLFDKDDIHTATWYLMSDFALSNDGIRQRLEQRGKCDRIRRGDLYTLETETLIVEIKILELEYGNEMEEKNSYFNNVVFDVIAREKKQG